MRVWFFRMLEVERRQAVRALPAAHAIKRHEFAEIAVAVAIHCEGGERESGCAVGGRQPDSFDKKNSLTMALEYDIPRTVVGTGPSKGTNISTNFQLYTIGYTHKF